MDLDALTCLMSGTSGQEPRLCRAGLSILTAVRLGSLAVGAKTLWKDEVADLRCEADATAFPGCLPACFDQAFPLSPFNLFLLQMASVGTHAVACVFLFRPPDSQGKGSWGRGLLRSKNGGTALQCLSLVAKALVEGLFPVLLHSVYGWYPARVICPPTPSCTQTVRCTVQNAAWKDAFNLFMAASSWLSAALCFVALYFVAAKILRPPPDPAKSHLQRPLLGHLV